MPEMRIKRDFSSAKQFVLKCMLLKTRVTLASSVSRWHFTPLREMSPFLPALQLVALLYNLFHMNEYEILKKKHQSLNLSMRHIPLFIHGNNSFISKGVCRLHCVICCSTEGKALSFCFYIRTHLLQSNMANGAQSR